VASAPIQGTIAAINEAREIGTVPVAILDRKLGKLGHKAIVYVLVQWSTGSRKEATWELCSDMGQRFPHFNLSA